MATSPNWAGVLLDVLLLILRRLPIPDILRCASVCTSWAAAVRDLRSRRLPLLRQPPWLLLTIRGSDGSHRSEISDASFEFYSLTQRRFYTVRLRMDPPIRRSICAGANNGWMILVDYLGAVNLLNPITKARITNIPTFVTWGDTFFYKAAVSSSPSEGNWAVMVITEPDRRLSYARAGDTNWAALSLGLSLSLDDQIEVDGSRMYVDVVFHEGLFYTINLNGVVEIWDLRVLITDGSPSMSFRSSLTCSLIPGSPENTIQVCMDGFAFHSFKSKRPFKVYKNGASSEVTSLGNYAILVSKKNAIYVSCVDYPELKSNCIYCVDNLKKVHCYTEEEEMEIRVYSLEDRSIVPACPPFPKIYQGSFIWLMPSFN